MSDAPRYRVIHNVGPDRIEIDLLRVLRHGDRIVSVYPTSSTSRGDIFLDALVELRHPSWAAEGAGWCPGDPPPEVGEGY